jgi:RNA polymerase sigma-70 factor (ECF subfamily)
VSTDSDEILLESARRGDADAFSELLERHGTQVRRRIAAKISAHWRASLDAADVMQVTYMEAFMHIRSFTPRGPEAFLAWLTGVAENNLRDAIKGLEAAKRPDPRRQVATPHEHDAYVALLDGLGFTSSTPSQHAAQHESRAVLNEILGKMPADYQMVIRQYDLEGRPIADVAAAAGRSVGAVYMLRARALDRLRELLPPVSAFFSRTS